MSTFYVQRINIIKLFYIKFVCKKDKNLISENTSDLTSEDDDAIECTVRRDHLTSKLNSKMVPVLPFLNPSPIFPLHLLLFPVLQTQPQNGSRLTFS